MDGHPCRTKQSVEALMTITHAQVSDAVRAAYSKLDAPHGAALDPRNYREGYWALCDLFRDHVCVQTRATAVAGATAVYGWMPRIFGRLNDYAAFADVLSDLRRASTCSEALKIVASSSRSEDVLRFVNGSVVGTSKFLHFLNPSAILSGTAASQGTLALKGLGMSIASTASTSIGLE
jgi:hypothetical protein